jgi:hypothetical protein
MLKNLIVAVALASCALPLAAQTLVVEGVLSPAWLERGGKREPLATGMKLAARDRIHTGPGSRALIRMAEGSAVKLGENATLAIDDLLEKKDGGKTLVNASLDVVRGAFRFTTGVFSRQPAQRDIKVKIATITAGIRGTDVWGRSTAEQDLVCLIDGRISVEHGGREFAMAEPLLFFIAPRNQPPKPVASVDRKQVDQWADETELRDGRGAMRRGGRYGVDVVPATDANGAEQAVRKVRDAGYPAQVEASRDSYGGEAHHVRITGLATTGDAAALAATLKGMGFADAQAR